MELNQIKRSKLTEALNKVKDQLKTNAFFITSVRAVKDGSLQVEVCQNRRLGGRALTMLAMLNRSDERFRDENTLLFDWMKLEIPDFLNMFPSLKGKVSEEELKTIADSWKEGQDTGVDSPVYKLIHNVEKVHNVRDGKNYTPVIIVTEMTETELRNREFYRGSDADEKIANELETEYNVMKTGKDGDYLVSPDNGDKIFRFVRTTFVEENAVDKIIAGKLPKAEYDKRSKAAKKTVTSNPEEIALDIDSEDSI